MVYNTDLVIIMKLQILCLLIISVLLVGCGSDEPVVQPAGVEVTGEVVKSLPAEEPEPEPEAEPELAEPEPEPEPEPSKPAYELVEMLEKGFVPDRLVVDAGTTVRWEVTRGGRYDKGMVIGVRSCRDVKSKMMDQGEYYEYTFTEPVTCTIVDGILTTVESTIIVE